MQSKFLPKTPAQSRLLLIALVLVAVTIATLIDRDVFAGFVTAAVLVGAVYLYRMQIPVESRLFWPIPGIAAAAFPALASRWGEAGVFYAAGLALLICGGAGVVAGLQPGSTVSIATAINNAFYLGFTSAFLVILRSQEEGFRLVLALLLMAAAYLVVSRVAGPLAGGPALWGEIPWIGALAGIAAAGLAGVASSAFIDDRFTVPALLIVGLVAGAGAFAGDLTSLVIQSSEPEIETEPETAGKAQSVMSVLLLRAGVVLFCAPALYYAFRLYLT